MKNREIFLSDEQRGIDRTCVPANDCGRIQNAPRADQIPQWWLDEGEQEQIQQWVAQLRSGDVKLVDHLGKIVAKENIESILNQYVVQ